MGFDTWKKRLSRLGDKKPTPEALPPPGPSQRAAPAAGFAPRTASGPGIATNPVTSTQPPPAAAVSQPNQSWPIIVPILPQEGLEVLIYPHKIQSMISGELYCWTYISRGLARVGQKEVVFTIRRRVATEREIDYPKTPLQWYEFLHGAAKNGQTVDAYQRTEFHSPSFLNRPDFKWVVYCDPHPIRNVPASYFPLEWLQAIPLLAPEADVANQYGVSRALSHLGFSERWFPFIPWVDRDRQPCITMENMAGTIKDSMPFVVILGISALRKGPDIVLHVSSKSAPSLKESLSQFALEHVFALSTTPFKDADSGLMWKNTDTEPRGYGTVMITNSTWASFRKAIEQSSDYGITFANGMGFRMEFQNPMPRQNLAAAPTSSPFPSAAKSGPPSSVTRPGFVDYTPPEPEKSSHVHCDHIALLDNNMKTEADVLKVTDYIKLAENAVDATVPKTVPPGVEGGGKLVIEFDVGGPDRFDLLSRQWFKMSFSPPSLSALPMGEIYKAVSALPKPNIEVRTKFVLAFNVWGFKGKWD
ncbi:hypothetical protein FQN50_004988 [Emmonsiellopsis sp. PD_5]|nr:hypothetical protein FQN50_004988 [Emmonsiellopsis sp. PD_5]